MTRFDRRLLFTSGAAAALLAATGVSAAGLPKRGGLIIARQTGARAAEGQVLIFLDSHTEANYNWLPPLLGKRKLTLFLIYTSI